MASALSAPFIRAPLVDANGHMTAPWLQWFQALYNRVGGSTAPTINEVADLPLQGLGQQEFDAAASRLAGDFSQSIHSIDVAAMIEQAVSSRIESQTAELREMIVRLRSEINDLKQGVNA